MRHSHFTKEDLKEMKKLRTSGVEFMDIAKKFKTSTQLVRYYVGNKVIGKKIKHYLATEKENGHDSYKKILFKSKTVRYLRDKKGNIIGKESIPYKTPISIFTGTKISTDPKKWANIW